MADNGYEISFKGGKNVLKLDCVVIVRVSEYTKNFEIYTSYG